MSDLDCDFLKGYYNVFNTIDYRGVGRCYSMQKYISLCVIENFPI